MPKILITNDDSYEAKGLEVLYEAMSEIGKPIVVAPAHPKSACSKSLTITKPLMFKKVKENFYKLEDGTPNDCVYLALNEFFSKKKPDLIVSGWGISGYTFSNAAVDDGSGLYTQVVFILTGE
jgi:5'-nucleotidase